MILNVKRSRLRDPAPRKHENADARARQRVSARSYETRCFSVPCKGDKCDGAWCGLGRFAPREGRLFAAR